MLSLVHDRSQSEKFIECISLVNAINMRHLFVTFGNLVIHYYSCVLHWDKMASGHVICMHLNLSWVTWSFIPLMWLIHVDNRWCLLHSPIITSFNLGLASWHMPVVVMLITSVVDSFDNFHFDSYICIVFPGTVNLTFNIMSQSCISQYKWY